MPSSFHRLFACALALLVCAGAATATAAPVPDAQALAAATARTCGTPEPTLLELERMGASLRRARDEAGARPSGGTIQIAFHVIHSGDLGNVGNDQINEQIRELNHDYLGAGYRFSLASIDRADSKAWFKMLPGTGDEKRAKQALAIDPTHRLNVYTCLPGHDLLGWAYFPFSFPEDDPMHGVVIHYGSLPGGAIPNYDLGRTLVHEVGHYLGLFHTFQGGCSDPGDYVADTPAEATPNFGCPDIRNTCPAPGDDPIHNYMDYSIDACYSEFTPGQSKRIDAIVPAYRPGLLGAAPDFAPKADAAPGEAPGAQAGATIAFRGAWPNPFQIESTLRFTLPASAHVRLRLYDLAGHLVQSIVDADLPPGDHSAPLRAAGLPAGTYFASLRVGQQSFTRSVMLIR